MVLGRSGLRSIHNGSRLALIAGLALSASLFGSPAASHGATSAHPLVVDMSVGESTLDPAETCSLYSDFSVSQNVYAGLTQYGAKKGPAGTTEFDPAHMKPYLASSWKISKNHLVYTFTLRKGLRFPSGAPLDAKAVKYSFERTVTLGGCGAYPVEDGITKPALISSIRTPNSTTVVITLSRPDPNVLQDWSEVGIVDPGVVNAHGGVQKGQVNQWMAGHVAGYGPFNLASYDPGKQAVLVANPHFFEKPASSKIIINFINSDPTLVLQARSNAADVTLGMTKQSVHSFAHGSKQRVVAFPAPNSEQIGLVNAVAPFNNVDVRRALTYAVPYKQILSQVAFGYGSLFYGPLPPLMPFVNKKLEPARTYDLAKARALLAQSKISLPVNVTMVIQEGNTIDQQIATVVQGVWAQLGIHVNVQQLAPAAYSNAIELHKVQAYMRLSGPGVIEPGYYLGYDMTCGNAFNLTDTCIPRADQLLNQARATQNRTRRQQLYNEITKLWIADAPKIPVYADKYAVVLSNRVKHFHFSIFLDMRTWSAS